MCGHHGGHTHTTHTSSHPMGVHEDPKQILQLRYARGEITREEYLQMLADLEGTGTPAASQTTHEHHTGSRS